MKPLSRRTVLRGAAGFGLCLPFLEAMMDNRAFAQAAPPKRYLLGFAGCSLGGYDGDIAQTFVPSNFGPNYDLKPALLNLAPIQSSVSVVSNLKIPWATGNTIPPGGKPIPFHGYQVGPMLTGFGASDGSFNGPTTEHIANGFLGSTTFGALVTRVQVSSYVDNDSPGTGQDISWRSNNGNIQPVSPRYSPQALFQALFGNFQSTGLTPDQVAQQQWVLNQRMSLLDSVVSRMSKLRSRLGAADRQRLDAHADEFRSLENRVAAMPPPMVGSCLKPTDPGADPTVGGNQSTSNGNITYQQNLGNSGEDARAQVMCDLIHMALACDLTRSVLFQFTNSQSFLNMQPITGQKSDLHELSHGGFGNLNENTSLSLARGINWHMKHWAYLLGKLQSTPEAGGTIFDSLASVFTFEGGQGIDPAAGQLSAHSTENMAAVIAGGAGGLKGGLHIDGAQAHPANVMITALKAIGYGSDTLGEISGEIPGLR